jgi:hypothetical protein
MPEYRRFKRKNTSRTRGRMNDQNNNWLKAEIKNICQVEVCLTTKNDLGENSAVEMEFLPKGENTPLSIPGKVRHVEFLREHNCFFSEIAFEILANKQKRIFAWLGELKSCIIRST